MQLMYSATSPYVRKVMIVAQELGLLPRIERLPCAASPVQLDTALAAVNPLAKVPALVLDDGTVLFDSPVICEYLASLQTGQAIFPENGPARWRALRDQALGDGILDAALLVRYESMVRPEMYRWDEWRTGQMAKITRTLDLLETEAAGYDERADIGTIALACALSYLDFRYADLGWRDGRTQLAGWFATFWQREPVQAVMKIQASA
ncbi:glutathione S-transferase N-terminal domain-containing protein [Robbsia sp. Bb-Pol-6]|uniref:Glutathione S-transferase N-terminal domain-containing protein n=1 Tax=Robbsia betulipollinis TaxID=2981849 RepID=A0ABT3ZQ53_9BURK|nr:glutathione S-transferase N-terminal domain-containing protein [Robbsia betulipollinis]MCY0388696.1 glutathione S-transferase N-terminal domain-containing protein [Robbsia betulipollinis]